MTLMRCTGCPLRSSLPNPTFWKIGSVHTTGIMVVAGSHEDRCCPYDGRGCRYCFVYCLATTHGFCSVGVFCLHYGWRWHDQCCPLLTLIQSAIKSNPKHEPSLYMTIPVHLSGEKTPKICHLLRLISHWSHQKDQPIPHRAISNLANPTTVHRREASLLIIETPNDPSPVQSNTAFVSATRHKNS